MNRLLRFSRALHKYIGLLLLAYLAWMAASGIGLNHPEWSLGWEMPAWLTPSQYQHADWNRGSLRAAVELDDGSRLLGGERGLFLQKAGEAQVFPVKADALPKALRRRAVHDLALAAGAVWMAGVDGLFKADDRSHAPSPEDWKRIELPQDRMSIQALLPEGQELLVLSDSGLWALDLNSRNWRELPLPRLDEKRDTISLVHWVFHMHDGRVWGLAGKILMDLAGLALIFLCLGAIYTWAFPKLAKRLKRRYALHRARRSYRWLLKHHLKVGVWSLPVLLLLGCTGFFMRPPTLLLIAGKEVPRWTYPGPLPDNPWSHAIGDGLIDHARNRLWLSADGLWSAALGRDAKGRLQLEGPCVRDSLSAPIFVMGSTVFQEADAGRFLLGSYSGLFLVSPGEDRAWDLCRGEWAGPRNTMKPDSFMTAGLVKLSGEWLMSDHKSTPVLVQIPENESEAPAAGRRLLQGSKDLPAFPQSLDKAGLPFWNWCFELHNGRLFRDWIGPFYLLVTPLGALLFVVLGLTGILDWLRRQSRRKRAEQGARELSL